MSTKHLVGYVGGLAVALGVGSAVLVNAPTASADSSSPSTHSSAAGTAKSARAVQRTNTTGTTKRAPQAPPRAARLSARDLRTAAMTRNVLSNSQTHNVTLSYAADPDTGKPTTLVSVVDAGTGEQVGATVTLDGYSSTSPVVTTDGSRAFVATTYTDTADKPNTLVAEIDTRTGIQLGFSLNLVGTLATLALSAQDTRAVVTTTWNKSDTGDILQFGGTVVAFLDSATGLETGGGSFLDGLQTNFVPSADGNHVLITTSYDRTTSNPGTTVVVFDTVSGTQSSPFLNYRGDSTNAAPLLLSPDASTALIMTTVQQAAGTEVRVIDTTTGDLIGSVVTVPGFPAGSPIMTSDGKHVLISTLYYNSDSGNTVLALIDTAAGSQSGETLWVHGKPYDAPLFTPDGKHAVIVTTVKDSDQASTRTGVATLDTTTGQQVCTTLFVLGRVSRSPTVGANGIVIRTSAGLQATVDPTTGAIRTARVAFPWGFDMEAVSRAITGSSFFQAVGSALFSVGFIGVIALGVAVSYLIHIGEAIAYHLGLPPSAAATPW